MWLPRGDDACSCASTCIVPSDSNAISIAHSSQSAARVSMGVKERSRDEARATWDARGMDSKFEF
ncbi:hypothetical protein G5I_00916 [Acromyrmex echinatior]|uniref:Uncharacterized protein n=1 Tax=Acromyrmex echinatior TaxID=103372 RepID=F4W623_ACREC|nr:hypothetical protein G5I_00916 [Acromyrmex echinatior]